MVEGFEIGRKSEFRTNGTNPLEPLAVLDELNSAPDIESAWARFSRRLARTGFGRAFFGYRIPLKSAEAFNDTVRGGILLGTVISRDYEDFLVRHPEVQKIDPIVAHCRNCARPINWTDPQVHRSLSPAQARLWHIVQDHGVTRGLSIPLHDFRRDWFGQICILARDGAKAFDAALAEHGEALHLAALYFHGALACRGLADNNLSDRVLSPRETECLLRLARGMRGAEVAGALGLSDRTVEHYLASARRKLKAATSTEAVAKAILRRIIHP